MTRPKGDTDPWLLDPIARDRVVANVVVKGMREMIGLMREIRDEMAKRHDIEAENAELRADIADIRRQITYVTGSRPVSGNGGATTWHHCAIGGCSLPPGHVGNHRGSRAQAGG